MADAPTMSPTGMVTSLDSPSPRPPVRPGDGPFQAGQQLGPRYTIIRLLGMGGMGAVYQAWDQELGVAVALKVIRPEAIADPAAAAEMERRFKRELLLARQVTHNNVVRIYDLGELDGIKYITMSYIEGEDLATRLKRDGKLAVAPALAIAKQVAAGLAAANHAGVVHRDLKPENIMIDEGLHASIMDFGIARSVAPATLAAGGPTGAPGVVRPTTAKTTPPTTLPTIEGATMAPSEVDLSEGLTVAPVLKTRRGAVASRASVALASIAQGGIVGTLEYMAPEQARGEAVDQRADIYAFGMILSEMLVGRWPVPEGLNRIEALQHRCGTEPVSLRIVDAAIPEALDAVVVRCLQIDRATRFESTADLVDAMDRLDDNGELIPIKRVVGARLVGAGAVVAAALLAWTWWAGGRAGPVAHEPISVVIADFDNRTNEPVFQGTIENALGLALEGASFITSYRREDAQRAVAQIKPGAKLDEAGARLLSAREGITVVLTGSIERAGSGYTISVKVIDPAVDTPLAQATARAASKDEVLRAVGSLASEIRSALGDETPETTRLAAAETVTAASLEALQNYTRGQELQINSKYDESIAYYRRAIEQDPKFGRAYASWAVSAFNLGRRDEADGLYKQAFALMDRMTEREKYRTYGTYYLTIAANYEQAIDTYSTLLKLYPADRAARTNLAFSYFATLNFARALKENRRAMDIYQGSFKLWSNQALYAMYAGDFETAEKEASRVLEQSPTAYRAYLPRAMAALSRSDPAGARDAYTQMAAIDRQAASLAAMGLADLLMYQGSFRDAETALRSGILQDQQNKSPAAVSAKAIALAEALEAQGKTREAAAAIDQAIKASRDESTVVSAARTLVRLGNISAARDLTAELEKRLQPQPRAYAKIIEGEIAARAGKPADAVEAFSAAIKLADLWLARFSLGVAYVQADHYAEGLRELEACEKRRGEATAVFLNDVPSYRYMAPLPYWLARAQEGIGQKPAALENYKKFLALRPATSKDPLAADARKRIQ